MSAGRRVVIVGAGQGGFQTAACLRQEGFAGSILMIGDEPGLPYQRPPLSKAYLKEGDAARLELRPRAFYERLGIELGMPNAALEIDRQNQTLHTADGARHPYDSLVLATGSACFRPAVPGAGLPGICELRSLKDADRLREALKTARRIVVIGGGFIGLEFASVALQAGHAVTLVEALPRLMARAVSASLSSAFARFHQASGLTLRLSESVTEITAGAQGGYCVALGSDQIECDLVLMATGVRPNVSLAASAGLVIENGVSAGGTLQTSDPQIFALGDCASFPDPFTGRRVRLESVQAAVDHARLVAKNIAKQEASVYGALPWFWSDQGGWKLQIAGLSLPGDDEVLIERDGQPLSVFRFRSGRLVGLETVNGPSEHMAARKILQAPVSLSRKDLEERDFDLKGLAQILAKEG